ncbi:MAG: hypothetical protein WCA95_15390, partial [Opitutaceae bacterium]
MSSISPQKRNGQIVGYSVYLGVDGEGRRQRRFFRDRSDCERFLEERNKTPLPIGELWDRRTEILYNLERLRTVKTSLTDVVTFYLTNGVKPTTVKLSQVVEEFLSEKLRTGRSKLYDRTMRYCYDPFMKHVGVDRLIGDITRHEVFDYVYVRNKHVRPITKRNLLTCLSVLFNFSIKRDYIETNPVDKIDRPTVPFQRPSVLSP